MSEPGLITLLPVIITLVLSIWSRNVVLGLFVGVFSGVLILNGPNPFTGMALMINDYFVAQASSSANMGILLLMIFVAGLVGLMQKSGGAAAFAGMMTQFITSKARAQTAAWASGSMLFFTDSGTPLIVGPLFRPIIDGLKISRAKLAWIIDSTASPVAVLVPFIGWGLYSQGLIAQEYKSLGIDESAFLSYIKAMPFQFYSIMAVVMVPIVVMARADFGSMKKAEEDCSKGIMLESVEALEAETLANTALQKAQPIMVWLPLMVMLVIMFSLLVPQGFPFDMANMPSNAFRASLSTGYICAALVLMLLMNLYGVHSLAGAFTLYLESMSKVVTVLIILVLAWSLGAIGKDLGAPAYISALIDGRLPVYLIPASAFVVGGIISFSTGSSWGTYGILIPLMIPIAVQFDVPMYVAIGAVLSGGLFGDHCSPISDTTILSATGAGCSQVDHVKTQFPYSLFNGGCSLIAYIVAGLSGSIWALGLGVLLLVIGLLITKKLTAA
ncbi:MAG: Na+/H+ antiporter NhaC family protein [Porticoccaceae bacterium]|jgi:Na+/H+ antiporter NhaC|nr:Na+/H+ antiporter NhaC family protein [Porticoccaceae bacterium]MDG1310534.1 Na+/H+ antiporter NhaC family protein [Porticoccaceae bacterium]